MSDFSNPHDIKTLGQLKASGYYSRSVKEELRENLIRKMREKAPIFPGVVGYEETVIPDIQRAIL
ncbi:MAG: magnesium chelatase, partial [Bacteroidota bacterium]